MVLVVTFFETSLPMNFEETLGSGVFFGGYFIGFFGALFWL